MNDGISLTTTPNLAKRIWLRLFGPKDVSEDSIETVEVEFRPALISNEAMDSLYAEQMKTVGYLLWGVPTVYSPDGRQFPLDENNPIAEPINTPDTPEYLESLRE